VPCGGAWESSCENNDGIVCFHGRPFIDQFLDVNKEAGVLKKEA
jgi:hypothetical protein